MVLLYAILMPLIVLINWLFFLKGKYNYAETGVLQLYIFSFVFIATTVIALTRFIWPQLDTAYIELPLLSVYSVITFLRFYNTSNRWLTAIKSLAVVFFVFMLSQKMEDFVVGLLMHRK